MLLSQEPVNGFDNTHLWVYLLFKPCTFGLTKKQRTQHLTMRITMNFTGQSERTETLESLSKEWLEAKKIETNAIGKRRFIEQEMIRYVEIIEEGTFSKKFLDMKVSIVFKIDRKVDEDLVKDAWNELPEIVRDAFRWKPDIVTKHARDLESANPHAFSIFAKFITSKPARPYVKVEEIQNGN